MIPVVVEPPRCPDCGVEAGLPHEAECDVERSTVCEGQRLTCGCVGHKPILTVWRGRLPISKNVESSVALSQDGKLRAKMGHCYLNCFRAVQELPEFHESTYVEGIGYLEEGFQVEHAWLEREDEIIDPTLPTKRAVYFSGLRLDGVAGLREAMAIPSQKGGRDLPFFHRFGFGGCLSPEFAAA